MPTALKTHCGLIRSQNEDAAWFDDRTGLYAVADGMGGHLAGEVASAMAIQAVLKLSESGIAPSVHALRSMVENLNEDILEKAYEEPSCHGMGTTLTMMWIAGKTLYIAHVGDSRLYRLSKKTGVLRQITRDHSLVEEMVRSGMITRQEARTHPRRNIITRALGTEGDNTPDLLAADLHEEECWLLCSDGLNSMVDDERICAIASDAGATLEEKAGRLVQAALEAGGHDNVTVILHEEEGSGWNPD